MGCGASRSVEVLSATLEKQTRLLEQLQEDYRQVNENVLELKTALKNRRILDDQSLAALSPASSAHAVRSPRASASTSKKSTTHDPNDSLRETVEDFVEFTIVHFNDVYHLEPHDKEPVGGAARFFTAVRSLSPDLVLFSGDCFNPSLTSTVTKGKHMVPVLNMLGVNAAVFGNHDFDFGVETLEDLARECSFPWLMSNVVDTATGRNLAGGLTQEILECRGLKVGLIGIVEEDWLETIEDIPETAKHLGLVDFARDLADKVRAMGADVVIALTHSRMPNDELLAAGCPNIDLILGGHDHFYEEKRIDGTCILNSGSDFQQLTHIRVRYTPGTTSKPEVITKRVDVTREFAEDEAMVAVVKEYSDLVSAKLAKKIGETTVMLDARNECVRTRESNIGNFITDIMRATTNSDLAILNGGTIRSNETYGPGPLQLRHLMDILPIEDPVVSIKLTGAQVIEALENGVSKWPTHEGRFPQVSGMSYVFDGKAPPQKRIISVDVKGQPIEKERVYTVATRAYLTLGKDGYDVFANKEFAIDAESGVLLPTMVRNYFEQLALVSRHSKLTTASRRVSTVIRHIPEIQRLQGERPSSGQKGRQVAGSTNNLGLRYRSLAKLEQVSGQKMGSISQLNAIAAVIQPLNEGRISNIADLDQPEGSGAA